uniref:Retrotransposon gag domain-containing protein n=1 Tax=Tanacetum cinerariifolium TaxID=118510 RepID=A0A6L2N8L0_TANCI|nr:hypothetical protein [Tanacetum cinerariifolium]
MEIGTADAKTVVDLGRTRRSLKQASAGGTMEIAVDPLVTGGISESTGGDAPDLEVGQLVASEERARLVDRIRMDRDDPCRRLRRTMTNTRFGMTPAAIEEMINRRVIEALETHEANRNIRLRNGNDEGGNKNGNGNGNDFMKCQPLNFKGTKGVVGLIRIDAAFSMSWRELMKLTAEVYYPRIKIQKMESELWILTIKNNDLTDYTQRFQELTMLCTKMPPEEKDRVKKFIGGLPDNIQGNVIAAEPTRLPNAVRMANNLMGQKLKGYAMKIAENKRKFKNDQKDNRG